MGRRTKGIIASTLALTIMATGLTSHWEGRELRAYRDIVGVWTICDGETKGVHAGDVATNRECDRKLAKNLVFYEQGLDRCLTGPVPGKSKVAILSLTYNMGIGAICKSTLVRLANAGDIKGACNQFLRWNKARVNGRLQPVRGLTRRRAAERKLCLEGLAD